MLKYIVCKYFLGRFGTDRDNSPKKQHVKKVSKLAILSKLFEKYSKFVYLQLTVLKLKSQSFEEEKVNFENEIGGFESKIVA